MRLWGRRAGRVAAWLALSAVGASTRPFGVAATGLVAGAAIVAVVYAVRGGARDLSFTPRLRRGVAGWSILLAALLAWELFAWTRQPALLVPDPSHPTLSTLLSPWLEEEPGRFIGWLVWSAAGWWLVRP